MSQPSMDEVLGDFNKSVDDAVDKAGKGGPQSAGLLNRLFGIDSSDEGIEGIFGKSIQAFEELGIRLAQAMLEGATLKSKDYAQIFSQSAGAVANSFAPGTGPVAELLTSAVFAAFADSDSAGTQARKELDKFFADIFEPAGLAVLINNKLTEVSDLVFSGNQEGGLFAGLPAAAQAAFEGVGVAFEALNGIALDLGVNVGEVLANNLGGSLNNLGIALQTTGQSAEQLGDQIIQAGLKGDLSFQQVASSLHGVELAMQKGIPDGVGLVVQAFDNLKNAGVTGGRVSTDAMRDLADELLEVNKNASSIDELGASLIASGVATDEVSQLMEALKGVGLDTVQKLSEATDRRLFEALARLQTIEFPFAQTSKDLDDLLNKLDRIPDNIEKDITFNVKTNYTGDSRTVLNEAGVNLSPGGPGN